MKRSYSTRRSIPSMSLAVSAAAAVCGAAMPVATWGSTNTTVYVTSGTDLTAAATYTPSGVPVQSNDVVINSSTPTPASLTLNSSITIGTLNDLYTGATTITDNGTGGATLSVGGQLDTGDNVSPTSPYDLIYVAGAAGTSLTLTSTTGHSNSILVGNNGNLDVGTGSIFNYTDVNGGSLATNGKTLTIMGGGTVNIGSLTANNAALVSGTGNIVVAGAGLVGLPGAAGAGEVSLNLGATSTTSANNTFTGTTTINTGSVLAINVAGTTGTLAYDTTAGAITDNGTLVLAPFNGRTLAVSTAIGGTGSVLFQKSTTTSGAAFLNLTGVNTYSGGTVIGNPTQPTTSAGTLSVSSGTALGTGAVTIYGQAAVVNNLQISGGITIANAVNLQGRNTGVSEIVSASGNNTLSGNITMTSGGATFANVNNTTAGTLLTLSGNFVNNVSGSHTFDLLGAGDYLLSGTIGAGTGATAFIQSTTGTVTLTGSNVYTGGTTVAAGTLVAAAAVTGSTPLGTGTVSDATTLQFSPGSGITQTVAGAISGAGLVTHTGAGTTILSNNNTYAGGTTISGGTLQANGTTDALGTGSVAVVATATLAGGTKVATAATGGTVSVNGDFMGVSGGTITAGTGASVNDTVGTLSMTSLIADGGSYAVKLDGANSTAGNPGSGTAGSAASDLLVLGGVTVNGAESLTINPVLLNSGLSSFTNAAPGTTYSFVIADATGSSNAAAFDGLINQGPTSAIVVSNNSTLGTFALSTSSDGVTGNAGEDLLLNFTTATTASTPEPTSLLWIGIAAVPLALSRRRRTVIGT